ncbi:unnamed protein product [Adineta ricciae]|nr:unnamed protein product [Adineta ricciae]
MGFPIHDDGLQLNPTYREMRRCLIDFECLIEERWNTSRGLKSVPAKLGSLTVFACAPGTTADDGTQNGLFTKHLLRHSSTPNEDIRMIMTVVINGVIEESNDKQIPHVTSMLRHKYTCLYNGKQEWNRFVQTVAEWMGHGDRLNQLHYLYGVGSDRNGSIFIMVRGNHRAVRWTSKARQGQIVEFENQTDQLSPTISEVGCWQTGENSGALVAGGNNCGDQRNQLDHPTGIFVDEDQSVNVSDEMDDLAVNCYGQIYITDCSNHRVVRWCEGGREGEVVAGGNDQDSRTDQLSCPRGISFDSEGYFCVSDCDNHRVQKFVLISK